MEPGPLLERDAELARAAESLDRAREGRGGLLLIEGPAGAGRTRLLRAIGDLARSRDALVLSSARGSELERDTPFDAVRSVVEQALAAPGAPARADLPADSPVARLVAPGARRPAPDADEAFDLVHGLTAFAVDCARRTGALALLVDDAQWLDTPSLRVLAHVADRLESAPIVLAVAVREGDGDAPRGLQRLVLHPDATVLRPAPLSTTATEALTAAVLGQAPTDAFVTACRRATRGNPFATRALLDDLAADGTRPDDVAAEVLGDRAPADIARAVALRLAELPEEATELVRAVAVLGDPVALWPAAQLAGLEREPASGARDALERAGVLAAEAGELTFVQPLARAAVYRSIPSGLRARLHARAAALLRGEAAPYRIADHLLWTEPAGDQGVVDTLRAAARESRSIGSRQAPIAYLRRALAEPPAPSERFATLLALAGAEVHAWDVDAAAAHLREALELAPSADRRAEIALILGSTLRAAGDASAASEVLLAERTRLHRSDDEDAGREDMRTLLESELLHIAVQTPLAHGALRARDWPDPGTLADDTRGGRRLLMGLALRALLSGEPRERGVALARRALAGMPPVLDEPVGSTMAFLALAGLIEAGHHRECLPVLDWMTAEARRRGSLVGHVAASTFRARARSAAGDLDGAESDALYAWSPLRATPGLPNAGPALAALLDVHLLRGDVGAAAGELERSGLADAPTDQVPLLLLGAARLRVRVAQRNWEDALTESDRLEDACAALGVRLSGTLDRGPNRARVLLALGRADEAAATAREAVGAARRFGAPYALASALLALGTVMGDEDGGPAFEEAVEVAAAADVPYLHAAALIDRGRVLRRARSKLEAREPLRQALDIALSCGAHGLAGEARTELLASGARPRRGALQGTAALTPSEYRVARLAADGLSNPEIAKELFITRRTVEKHVGEAIRKLAVTSRADFADALQKR